MKRETRGFTLIEILVVLSIIGIVVALVAIRLHRGGENAKRQLTRISMSHVVASLQNYSLDAGRAPERLDDLLRKPAGAANWNGPYVDEKDLADAWGRRLIYRNPGERHEFELVSYGPDGRPGGEGSQAEDLVAW